MIHTHPFIFTSFIRGICRTRLVVTAIANIVMIFAAGCGMKRVYSLGLISHGTVEVERFARGLGLFLSWVSLIRCVCPRQI